MNLWYNIPCRLFGKILYFRRFRRWTETEGQYFLGSWQRLCVPLAWWLCVQAIRRGQKQPPADNPEEKPGESGSGNIPEVPSDSTENNGGNNTSNSTNTTTTTDNRTTDNSDNSRYSSTRDSNNTSTVNNYYQQEKQPSSSGESVQTIVVPVGNTGNGEPLQQTIRVESPEGTTATGSLEGLTLNINVNTASQDQAANTSPIQQSGISWYQAIVLCLLSAILVCLLKRRWYRLYMGLSPVAYTS